MLTLPATEPVLVERTRDSARRARWESNRHVIAVSVAAIAIPGTLVGWAPSPTSAVAIVVAAVVIGLPHGALDVAIGPRMANPIAFFGAYLLLAATTVAVWLLVPLLGFVMFFLASWFHFARGDADHHRQLGSAGMLLGISTAGCAIGLPLALHSATVVPVLSDLLGTSVKLSAEQAAAIGATIAYPSIVCGLVAGIAALQIRRFDAVVELTVIALLAVVVHPLVSFALYFSLWHSPRHLISLDVDRRAVLPTVAATAATLASAALVWRFVEPSTQVATQVIFIGLAGLTAPHLVVTELLRSRTGEGAGGSISGMEIRRHRGGSASSRAFVIFERALAVTRR